MLWLELSGLIETNQKSNSRWAKTDEGKSGNILTKNRLAEFSAVWGAYTLNNPGNFFIPYNERDLNQNITEI